MKHTYACVVVTDANVLEWFGHTTILSWCLMHLTETRGIDRIVCCSVAKHMQRAREATAVFDEVEVAELPAGLKNGGAICSWFCREFMTEPGVVVFQSPVNPFLKSGAIEECVEAVRSGDCLAALPSYDVDVISREPDGRLLRGKRPATLTSLFVRRSDAGDGWTSSFRHVPIRRIEAIDATDLDGRRIANALLAAGEV